MKLYRKNCRISSKIPKRENEEKPSTTNSPPNVQLQTSATDPWHAINANAKSPRARFSYESSSLVPFRSQLFLRSFCQSLATPKYQKKIQNSPAKARLAFTEPAIFHQQIILGGGWTNPSEKYARPIRSFPQFSGWKFQKYLSCHHLVSFFSFGGGMKVKFYSPVAVSCCSLPRTWDIGEFPGPKAPANRLEMFPSQSNPPQEPIEAVASQTSFVSSTKGTNM